jgi:cytochrome c5
MKKRKRAFVFAAAAAGLTVSVALHSQQSSGSAAKSGSSQVHSIVLPQYSAEIAPGPNVQVYEKDCLICHTARYISMQPHFPKSVWQAEVKKMIDAYGAVIPEADQPMIVDYLVAVRGAEAPASTPAPAK